MYAVFADNLADAEKMPVTSLHCMSKCISTWPTVTIPLPLQAAN